MPKAGCAAADAVNYRKNVIRSPDCTDRPGCPKNYIAASSTANQVVLLSIQVFIIVAIR